MTAESLEQIAALLPATRAGRRWRDGYLLRDGAGAFDELPFGEAVGGGDLQGSGLLDEEDASVSELLHSCFNLETNLEDKQIYCSVSPR